MSLASPITLVELVPGGACPAVNSPLLDSCCECKGDLGELVRELEVSVAERAGGYSAQCSTVVFRKGRLWLKTASVVECQMYYLREQIAGA